LGPSHCSDPCPVDGFTILSDADVRLGTQGKNRLVCPLRHLRIERDDGSQLDIITNDRKRSAVRIAALYKARWQIELLFRWIKQHLKLRQFLGRSENAIRLQILAAIDKPFCSCAWPRS
jgi:hypothetical protein